MTDYVYSHPKSNSYRYKFTVRGKIYEGPTGTDNRKQAVQMVATMRQHVLDEVAAARLASGKVIGRAADMSLDHAIGAFYDEHIIANDFKNPKDLKRRLGVILDVLGADTMVSEIDDAMIDAFRNKRRKTLTLRGTLPSNDSVNTELSDIQRLLNWVHAVKKVPVLVIDWKKRRMKPAKQRIRTLTIDEEKKILAEAPADYGLLMRFILATGLRRSSFTSVFWKNVFPEIGIIIVPQKGDREHRIIIDQEIEGILAEAKGLHPEVVFTFAARRTTTNPRTGNGYVKGQRYPITYEGFGTWFDRFTTKAGIVDLTIHDLRRSAGSTMLGATSMQHASKLLGHSSIKVTEKHYAFMPTEDELRASQKFADYRQKRRF